MFYPPVDSEDLENPKHHLAMKNIPVHIIVFGDNVFGVLFLTRKSISIYHRVTKNLTAINYDDIWMIQHWKNKIQKAAQSITKLDECLLNLTTTRQQFQAFEAIRSFAQPKNISEPSIIWTIYK